MAEIKIDTPFAHCKECDYLEIVSEELYADNCKYGKYFYCQNAHICRNAVTIAEKDKEKKGGKEWLKNS